MDYEKNTSLLPFCSYKFDCLSRYSSPHEATVNAVSFCEAVYDLDYMAAKDMATAASFPYISFIATNTTQQHVDKVKARGRLQLVLSIHR
ncbi:hypothetical protein NXY31_04900 [Bacteroides salyersiae]|nr:hypothetical protein [Bacteroides salyersiae]